MDLIGAVALAVVLFLGAFGVYRMSTKRCSRCHQRLRKSALVCTFCGKPQRRKAGV